jgi:hypothetical protein
MSDRSSVGCDRTCDLNSAGIVNKKFLGNYIFVNQDVSTFKMKTTDNSKWFIKIGQPETLARLEKTEGAIKIGQPEILTRLLLTLTVGQL